MKKHLFGFAIFGFIFASFAVAFAYFYAPPIPQISEVRQQPVYRSEPQTSCRKKSNQSKNIKYEVISSQYFYDENRIISKIKLTWNGYGNPPKKVNVISLFASSGNLQKKSGGTLQFFENPFAQSDSEIVTVVSKVAEEQKFNKSENLYAFINVSDDFTKNEEENSDVSPTPTQVVFVHGESSVIKKK